MHSVASYSAWAVAHNTMHGQCTDSSIPHLFHVAQLLQDDSNELGGLGSESEGDDDER